MSAELRPDGTILGGAVPTIWRAHELLDLGRDATDPALVRLLAWLMGRQGQPGAYGEGCDKARHAQHLCEHWARGFFSPAPAEVRMAPITLPNGKAFRVGVGGAVRASVAWGSARPSGQASVTVLAPGSTSRVSACWRSSGRAGTAPSCRT